MSWEAVGGSYRDPSGFVYTRNGQLLRQVDESFRAEYEACGSSGLYAELMETRVLVPHEEVSLDLAARPGACAVLHPEAVPFISYPYEWCFGQLRAAALLTLDVQERALRRGFVLRDASAYNVQFLRGRPLLIDTLSFERQPEGRPWLAYRQFCEHFLVPLLLMSRVDIRCGSLLRDHLEGIPLDLGSALLTRRSWTSFGALLHVHLHARAQKKFEHAEVAKVARGRTMSKNALIGLARSLRGLVASLNWEPTGTQWAEYAREHNYTTEGLGSKQRIVDAFLSRSRPETVWDAGANTGEYSRLASAHAGLVVSLDMDAGAVERGYRRALADEATRILPLLVDLVNPSPAQGWAHQERLSIEQRGPADAVLALALVHHLAIGHNVPLEHIAAWFARIARTLIVEFVPKSDSQVRRLLRNRPDIFPSYSVEGFQRAFGAWFDVQASERVEGSERTLYLMSARRAVGRGMGVAEAGAPAPAA